MSRISKIQKDNPQVAAREEVRAIAVDIDTYAALAALKTSEGGVLLYKTLVKDVANCIDEITGKWNTADNLTLMGLCAKLSERITILKMLDHAKTNLELAEEALKELTT